MTVSIGVAELTKAADEVELVRAADTRLYTAKKAGRNRICNADAIASS